MLNLIPDNLVLSASQIGKAVAGVHYNRNNKNATAYGTAMHKMVELWSQNLIKKGSISELEKLFHSGKINIEDLSEIGLVVYNNNIISGTQGYFPNGVFEGMDKIRNVNLYYENKYPKSLYKSRLLLHEKEMSTQIGGKWFSATLDSVWEITI